MNLIKQDPQVVLKKMDQKKPFASYLLWGGLFFFIFYLAFWPLVWHAIILSHARPDRHQLRVESYYPNRVINTSLFLDKPDSSLNAYTVWRVPKEGLYRIRLICDDNGSILIDNQNIITLTGINSRNVGENTKWLAAGPHFLELRLNNILNQGWLRMEVAKPGQSQYAPLSPEEISYLELGNIESWLDVVPLGKRLCLLGFLWLVIIWACLFFARWVILIFLSLLLTVTTGEIFLRIIFREVPGDTKFENVPDKEEKRNPIVKNPKGSGLTRILIQGDSITHNEPYPVRLLQLLNQKNIQYDLKIVAEAGWEIDAHRDILANEGPKLQPDIIIYQWYVNDLEINKDNRPERMQGYKHHFWQGLITHRFLLKHSYFYHFLDLQLDSFLHLNRSYVEYLLEDYDEKTPGWFLFRVTFHDWATMAKCYSKKRIIMLYPALSFGGDCPLKPINDRMKKICSPNRMTFPSVWVSKGGGEEVRAPNSYLGRVLYVTQENTRPGIIMSTPKIYLEKGEHQAIFRLRGNQLDKKQMLNIKIMAGNYLITEKKLIRNDFKKEMDWIDITIPFFMDRPLKDQIQFQIEYLGHGTFWFDYVQLPVDYGIEVVDLLPYLKNKKTWIKPYDAHPDAKTHQIMAEVLSHSKAFNKPLSTP